MKVQRIKARMAATGAAERYANQNIYVEDIKVEFKISGEELYGLLDEMGIPRRKGHILNPGQTAQPPKKFGTYTEYTGDLSLKIGDASNGGVIIGLVKINPKMNELKVSYGQPHLWPGYKETVTGTART